MSSSKRTPQMGDIVLLQQGIGVIRYRGEVDFDEGEEYFGVELKGPQITGGHNGTYNGKKYFVTKAGDGRGIFIRSPQILRIISSEEILEKLAEIYDILKGRRGHSHFIDRQSYNDLYDEHDSLKLNYDEKLQEVKDLKLDLSLLKEQISMMKGTLGDKIEETAKMTETNTYMTEKIRKAEDQLGSRLSQTNLGQYAKILQSEQQEQNNEPSHLEYQIPDYSKLSNGNGNTDGIGDIPHKTKRGHTKQRSSTTIELDQLQDNFSDIARSVQAYGQKDIGISGPHHYRKFSNTTKQIMEQHKVAGVSPGQYGGMNGNYNDAINSATNTAPKRGHRARGSMKIGDIVDEDGIDIEYESDQDQDSNSKQRQPKSRASRESRQLDGDEVNQGDYFDGDELAEERSSHSDNEGNDGNEEQPKRKPKTRASRESKVIEDVDVIGNDDNDEIEDQTPPKRTAKTRASRESRQMDPEAVGDYDEDIDEDEDNNNNTTQRRRGSVELDDNQQQIVTVPTNGMSATMNGNGANNTTTTTTTTTKKTHKARGSFTLEDPITDMLTTDMLEAHNEANGDNTENQKSGHTKNKLSMTSDSSAYRAFMSVD